MKLEDLNSFSDGFLECHFRSMYRSYYDHFEIVDEYGLTVESVIKIDPNELDDGINSDILEFNMHRVFAVKKDGTMMTYQSYLDEKDYFINGMIELVRSKKSSEDAK